MVNPSKSASHEVSIGNLKIGANNPIRIQSMTNTNTLDTKATVEQVVRLVDAGCEIVRITAQGTREAENLANIKRELSKKGIHVPLVADIHFNPKAAEVAAAIVEKVRINPGNYVGRSRGKVDFTESEYKIELEKIAEKIFPLINICKQHGTAIRIGTNHGSISERILAKYGNTPKGMVASAMEFIHICRDFDFHELVLSMKASNVAVMKEANELLVKAMLESGFYYPLHLGVTEAGNGLEGRVKAAAGIGGLLAIGIGDTIRVSLTEEPEAEIPVAKNIVELFGQRKDLRDEILLKNKAIIPVLTKSIKTLTGENFPVISNSISSQAELFKMNENELSLSSPKGNISQIPFKEIRFNKLSKAEKPIIKLSYRDKNFEKLQLFAAAEFSVITSKIKPGGIWIDAEDNLEKVNELSLAILQAMGLRFSKTEFIACPSCGRTLFNLMTELEKVKSQISHLKGLKIAVMGCIVNGPGEMADADYGYVGAGPGKVTLYKGKEAVLKNIDEEKAVESLISLIKEGGDWRNC